jgi:hypothetical protein
MTRVGWLADSGNLDGTNLGGAEFTQAEFAAAAPDGADIVFVPHDADLETLASLAACDVVCCFNVGLYPQETLQVLAGYHADGGRVIRYWNDVAPHGDHDLTRWFVNNATSVFCSPLHYQRFPWVDGAIDHELIPPPVDLDRFREAAARSNGNRKGVVSVAAWRGWGKTPYLSFEWARRAGVDIDFYGGGATAPAGSKHVPYDELPDLLARYGTFVYLPSQLEPFCRTVVEAWAAGCRVVTNGLVGATYWVRECPHRLDSAGEDFWKLVLR